MIARCREKRRGEKVAVFKAKGFFSLFSLISDRHPSASIRLPTLSSSSDRDKYSAKREGEGEKKITRRRLGFCPQDSSILWTVINAAG